MHQRESAQSLNLGACDFPLARVERASFFKVNLVVLPATHTYLVLRSLDIGTVATSSFSCFRDASAVVSFGRRTLQGPIITTENCHNRTSPKTRDLAALLIRHLINIFTQFSISLPMKWTQ